MATSSFKSNTRRSSLAPAVAGSSTRTGRSRSLSRYSDRFPPPPPESHDFATPRAKFVNKTRGSGFGEIISLDDLADEFFGVKGFGVEDDDGSFRSGSDLTGSNRTGRSSERFLMETEASKRRGRSVSKKGGFGGNGDGLRVLRRSISVARQRTGDLEDKKKVLNGELSRHDQIVGERNELFGKDRSSRQQRSASVARYQCGDMEDENNLYSGEFRHHDWVAKERKGNDRSSKQQRSASVARYRYSDLESDTDKSYDSCKIRSFDSGDFQSCPSRKQMNAYALRSSMSQKELLPSVDNYSSHSSSLTDDELRDVRSLKSGCERTIQTVYTQEKAEHPTGDGDGSGLYEAMRNEVRHAVCEIRTELEKVMVKTNPSTLTNGDVNQAKGSNINVIAEIRRNYTNKLEQSDKRMQDLLAELAAEEQHAQELTNIVRELLPASKQTPSKPQSRRTNNDRTRMSKRLTEEAERHFEDFLSNVEDTDLSSFDGERSDTSSILGGSAKLREPGAVDNAMSEVHAILANASLLAETDGVLLPWLEWETSNDVSPFPCKSKTGVPWTAAQEANATRGNNVHLSNLGSWSSEASENSPDVSSEVTKNTHEVGSHIMQSGCFSAVRGAVSSFDMDEYLVLQRNEDLVFEISKHRQRMESGSLIMCARTTII